MSSILLFIVLGAPGLSFLWLGSFMLAGRAPREITIGRVTQLALALSFAASLAIAFSTHFGAEPYVLAFGDWFADVPLGLRVDRLTLVYLLLISALTGLVSRFSDSYLHRDVGFARFYLLLLLFAFAMLLFVTASGLGLTLVGWELLGLPSALLIAFFHKRIDPVQNGLFAFAIYRLCDLCLLTAAAIGEGPAVPFLLIGAAAVKSAQVPFGGWLPRAMEGPTPSSAIFYGGVTIHAGAYLLLRFAPVIEESTAAVVLMVTIGALTAGYAGLLGRVQADAKNQLAYASMAQLGLVFVEIGLGFHTLALLHVAGHASVRTLQFLRSPSLLHELHRLDAAAGGDVGDTGLYYEMIIPKRLRHWLYTFAAHRYLFDDVLRLLVVTPALRLADTLDKAEGRLERLFEPRAAAVKAPIPRAELETEQ